MVSAALLALQQWQSRLGESGLATMYVTPWLTAAVDQHAAVVRDTLAGRDGTVSVTDLAAYADGLSDAAAQRGWSHTEVADGDWAQASWPSLRLLAVCAIADAMPRQTATPDATSGR